MTLKFLAFPVLVMSIALASCDQNPGQQKQNDGEELSNSLALDTTNKIAADSESEVSYNLPSALQIAYVFKKSGSAFMPALPNTTDGLNKYNTSTYKRAVNFGIYSTDLAYCVFNKKFQESKNYLKACKETGSFLGLNQAFESDNTAQRFDKNISIEDSLVKIVSGVQLKTDVMFEQNKQKHITVMAFAGAWTESAYIAAEVYKKDKNKKVLNSLLEQLLLSETLIKALKVYENSEPEIKSLITSLEGIYTEFRSISSVKAALIAMENDAEIDFASEAMTDAEFEKAAASIKMLRMEMVK